MAPETDQLSSLSHLVFSILNTNGISRLRRADEVSVLAFLGDLARGGLPMTLRERRVADQSY
jgi:hypothetical protein